MIDNPKQIELTLQKYCVDGLVDAGIHVPPDQIKTYLDYRMEYMAYQLGACLRVPADIVQDHTVIAEYPSTGWDIIKRSIKRRLGRLGRWIRYETTQHRLSEHIIYPQVVIPQMADKARVYIQTDMTRNTHD